MKDKKPKYLEDLLEEYLELSDEETEVQSFIEKAQKKFDQYLSEDKNTTYNSSDGQGLFKFHSQIRKYQERQISYERKDENDKSKSTFIFSLENDEVKYTR
jgi:hypothetical protein